MTTDCALAWQLHHEALGRDRLRLMPAGFLRNMEAVNSYDMQY